MTRGRVVVVSGPSGSGKTSVCAELAKDRRFVRSVSATTRPARPGEVNGREYWFLDEPSFRERIGAGGFIEWAEVYGHLYGTPREPLERVLAEGKWVVLNIDTQGAERLREQALDAIYVFLMPPSLAELERRLRGRKTDGEDVIARRLALAAREMAEAARYDAVVVNDDLGRAAEEVRRIVFAKEEAAP